jgi:hypothetical protein
LSAAAGKTVQVGVHPVHIHPPAGRRPIDPSSPARYLARIEVREDLASAAAIDRNAAEVVWKLFGIYLETLSHKDHPRESVKATAMSA